MDVKALRGIAKVTMTRGAHAWGMAWIDSAGRMRMYKQTGRIVDALSLLAMASDARFLIGHCRWATHGSPADNANNHPHPADGGWYVHNGVIHNHEKIASDLGREPATECDSEVLGMLIEDAPGRYMERCVDAVEMAGRSPLAMLGLWKPGRMIAVRRGNPLHLSEVGRDGYYLASLPENMPGKVRSIKDGTVTDFTAKGAEYAEF
jgi:glucosamine--fructose-6-phosphate aminotransferase (isomerizing)